MNRVYTVAAMIALNGALPSLSRATTLSAQEPAGYSARLDGTSDDYIFDSIPDAAGNVIVVGRSRSAELNLDVYGDRTDSGSDMRPGPTSPHDVLVTHPNGGGFVIKYDREGKIVWKRFVGKFATDSITGVTVDPSG